MTFRSGDAERALSALAQEVGAEAVYWTRDYNPDAIARDTRVKAHLKGQGIEARSFRGQLLFEPQSVHTKQGDYYKVYSPFWRAVRDLPVDEPLPTLTRLIPCEHWPATEDLLDWQLGRAMHRGAGVVLQHCAIGEEKALERLDRFLAGPIDTYKKDRDFPSKAATSRLSENLAYGEISARTIWHRAMRKLDQGAAGAEHFLKELVWREFAYHLAYHSPRITRTNWKEKWDHFPWSEDETRPEVVAWKQGRTGVPFVDAAMREMYVTGTMHNRARMIAASYLTKHLMAHWRIGQKWFADCLIDWDPAANAMGWQWVAGSGPDAAPYFRIFNPDTQMAKFDPEGIYVNSWLAELGSSPSPSALAYFDAVPADWRMRPDAEYPDPVVSLPEGRKRALTAFTRFSEVVATQ